MNTTGCFFVMFFAIFFAVKGEEVNATQEDFPKGIFRGTRSNNMLYAGMASCAMKLDAMCFVGAAEDYLESRKDELLVEADAEAFRTTGRSDADHTPSQLAKSIQKMISELASLFRDGLSGFFKNARQIDEKEEEEDEEDDEEARKNKDTSRGSDGVQKKQSTIGRKKKDGLISKIFTLVKLVILGIALAVKVCLAVKVFHAIIKFKYMLIAAGWLLLNAIRLWVDAKHHKSPPKVIHYEHAHHDHHYEDEGDWSGLGESPHAEDDSGYWKRTDDGQNQAYSKQKPLNNIYSLLG